MGLVGVGVGVRFRVRVGVRGMVRDTGHLLRPGLGGGSLARLAGAG